MKTFNTTQELFQGVCNCFDVNPQDVRMRCRKKGVVMVRHLYCWVGHTYYKRLFSLKNLGMEIGGRDHTTVINGRDKINALIDSKDEIVVRDIQKLKDYFEIGEFSIVDNTDLIQENEVLKRFNKKYKVEAVKLNHEIIALKLEIRRLNKKINILEKEMV